ncbi:MAG: arginyltransferase [Alphaproteobacteria bacterium]
MVTPSGDGRGQSPPPPLQGQPPFCPAKRQGEKLFAHAPCSPAAQARYDGMTTLSKDLRICRSMNLFFSTELAPCPYLEHKLERRLVLQLGADTALEQQDRLVLAGFRRSQTFAYRPTCPGCQACVPVRIPVEKFAFTRGWRRILRRNADLTAETKRPKATEEQFQLFRHYLAGRHADGGMAGMGWAEYRSMLEDCPSTSHVIEWRRPDQSLIGVSITDQVKSGLSGVYKFFDPEESRRSLGSQIILWHVQRALELGLAYVYLGYWIAASPKMDYKARFKPLERLTKDGWMALEA